MREVRSDPERLLDHVRAEEACAKRGRLRIFFGASAGVGKTYAMLEAARGMRTSGTDVVVGYVEPHGRAETERLLEGLPQLPSVAVRYHGIVRQEFDLDAALTRHPAILLVDELAHSNLIGGEPALRHPKRWQDIEELLNAGITVWTTVNVQHLESLNDLVAQITGVRQRETVPDRVFDEADGIELIDLPPEDLLSRLRAGKVYIADEVATAVERFFRIPNLMALREMSLRRVADRVEAGARALSSNHARGRPAGDRILVAVGPDAQAEQLVRAGKRIAEAFNARWTVVYVETPRLLRLSSADRNRRVDVLRLAESLGAETVTLDGPTPAAAILEYVQTRNATRVVVGAPKRYGWRAWLRPSASTVLVRQAKGFDVTTVALAEPTQLRRASSMMEALSDRPRRTPWAKYAGGVAITALSTGVAFALFPLFEQSNLVMVYLLGVTISGLRLGRGPSILTAILNVLAFDFFFAQPRYKLPIANVQFVVTLLVMLVVAVVIATLTASVRQQTRVAGARERRSALLYEMSRELASTRDSTGMARVAVRHVAEVFQCRAVVLLPDTRGRLRYPTEPPIEGSFRTVDLAVGQWVLDHGRQAGIGTDTLPATQGLLLPLGDEQHRLGVLAVLPTNRRRVLLPERRHLLETFASQIGLALERAHLAEAMEVTHLAAERESLRSTLLASISHDLRTPLSVITGAAGALANRALDTDYTTRSELMRSIETKAQEMSELVTNVLELMRFESGEVTLRRDWQTLDDLIGAALQQASTKLERHPVQVNLPVELLPVYIDATLIVQVFSNLFDNIAKYTPAGTSVHVSAVQDGVFVRVMIDDEGPGLPPGDPARLFQKFHRGKEEGTVVGVGLGLAICQAIVQAHDGTIEALQRDSGGASFRFTLPTRRSAS